MKRLITFVLVVALATVQSVPAFAQHISPERTAQCRTTSPTWHPTDAEVSACLQGFEREAQVSWCAAQVIPGHLELMTKLGGASVYQNGRVVYYPPTFVQLNNGAYATPYDSGVAAAIWRYQSSCLSPADKLFAFYTRALWMFSNGLITYGMLSTISMRVTQLEIEQINATPAPTALPQGATP
jgi:hypothetical protein